MARLSARKEMWAEIPGDTDKAKVKIIHLTPGEIQQISNDTSRWVGKRVDKEMESELEYSPLEQMKKTRIAAVVDWDGFYDAEGNKMKCNRKNVEEYLNYDPELGVDEDGKALPFSEWIDKFRDELAKTVAPKEELEKN